MSDFVTPALSPPFLGRRHLNLGNLALPRMAGSSMGQVLRAWLLYFPYLHFLSILLFFNTVTSFSAGFWPIVALFLLPSEAYEMRRIWILSAFALFMGVNSFDFRCNLPDERFRWEIKEDQRGVKMSQDLPFAPLESR